MSSPLKRTSPFVTSYPGRPISTLASVDLPEPFGPMRAWISPCRTMRSMPFRISLPSTVARRSWISSVAVRSIVAASATVHLDQDLVVLHLHRIDMHGHGGGEGPRPAGLQVERGPVLRALDRPEVRIHIALGEVLVRVRADVVDGPELAVAHVRDRDLTSVHRERPDLALGDVTGSRYLHERHDPRSSSRSMVSERARRTS